MQQRSGSTHHIGDRVSTSRRVQSSSSGADYGRAMRHGENANHQHSSPQSRNTQHNTYSPSYSHPVVVHRYQQQSTETQGWQTVPRSWTQKNTDASHHTRHSALDRNQLAPSSSRRDSSQGISIHNTSNRVTLAELERLNEQSARTTTMDRWRSESQREGPWDGVGYLRSGEDRSRTNGW